MAGPVASAANNPHKLKGGKWTVFRFFLVSTAYTSTWLAVSSQLGNYRELYGPQVLLQLNIAYFLPSIPLLIVSGLFDKVLEAKLGIAKTILTRLLVGLLGYGVLCAWFPFQPAEIWYLLGSVVALGLFSGIAFSASYQLVARFANKNVIALGLGCSASGPLVLALQLLYGVGESPTKQQEVWLYETIAVIVVAGLWATTSLLVRHWDGIEAFEERHRQEQQQQQQQQAALLEPLLGSREEELPAPTGRHEDVQPFSPLSPTSPAAQGARPHATLPGLISYSSLEPFQTFLTADDEAEGQGLSSSWSEGSLLDGHEETGAVGGEGGGGGGGGRGPVSRRNSDPGSRPGQHHDAAAGASGQHLRPPLPPYPRQLHPHQPHMQAVPLAAVQQQQSPQPPAVGLAVVLDGLQSPTPSGDIAAAAEAGIVAGVVSGARAVTRRVSFSSMASNMETGSPHFKPQSPVKATQQGDMWRLALETVRVIWPVLCALGLSSTIALLVFPFFTYVPTSGLLGELLPKTLFFVRIFADIVGRFLPRLRCLAVETPGAVLLVAFAKLACVPVFFVYLKSPDRFHSDMFAVVFVATLWVIGGYVNTMANLLAPRLVQPHLKATASGLMAIMYQFAHFLGLVIATVAALLLYGDIGVE